MLLRLLILLSLFFTLIIYAWLNPRLLPENSASRLVKLDAEGEAMNAWAGPWSCVLDQKTGLVWEVKTDSETIHDGYWTYSWYNEDIGVENSGDCFFETNRCDTSDLIRRALQEKICAKNGWRLPTAAELSTLVFLHAKPGEPVIDQDFFPHMQRSNYWAADAQVPLESIYSHLGFGAKAVNFIKGDVVALPYRNAAFVILVTDDN